MSLLPHSSLYSTVITCTNWLQVKKNKHPFWVENIKFINKLGSNFSGDCNLFENFIKDSVSLKKNMKIALRVFIQES